MHFMSKAHKVAGTASCPYNPLKLPISFGYGRTTDLLAKLQEIICPKGASFSATAASVAFWALLKMRLNKELKYWRMCTTAAKAVKATIAVFETEGFAVA
jgi:hypothetical protein